MTERKPPGMTQQDWVRLQLQRAQDRGRFDDLPLTGRPLPAGRLERPGDWVSDWVRRERIDPAVLLPTSLVLAREVEDLPERLTRESSEARVREIAADLDRRIRSALARPDSGPPMRTRPLDVEEVVEGWRRRTPPPASRPVAARRLAPVPALPRQPVGATIALGVAASAFLAAVIVLGVLLT